MGFHKLTMIKFSYTHGNYLWKNQTLYKWLSNMFQTKRGGKKTICTKPILYMCIYRSSFFFFNLNKY